jgi:nucleotide-binding universal stress UspA family protein
MNILLAADGSDYTRRAAQYLVATAKEYAKPPRIFIVTVHAPIPYPGAAAAAGKGAVESYQREECEKALAVAEAEFAKAGMKYESAWLVGEVAEEIASHAKKVGADLVVMGSHGRGAFLSMALGSTATKILATLKLPLLVVR